MRGGEVSLAVEVQRHAEVDEHRLLVLRLQVAAHDDVLRLDVHVEYAVAVYVGHGLADGPHVGEGLFLAHGSLGLDVSAVEVLHDEVGGVVRLDDLVDGHHMPPALVLRVVGVLHVAYLVQQPSFLDEVLEALLHVALGLDGIFHGCAVGGAVAPSAHEVFLDGEPRLHLYLSVAYDGPHLIGDAEAALSEHFFYMVLVVFARPSAGHVAAFDDGAYGQGEFILFFWHIMSFFVTVCKDSIFRRWSHVFFGIFDEVTGVYVRTPC